MPGNRSQNIRRLQPGSSQKKRRAWTSTSRQFPLTGRSAVFLQQQRLRTRPLDCLHPVAPRHQAHGMELQDHVATIAAVTDRAPGPGLKERTAGPAGLRLGVQTQSQSCGSPNSAYRAIPHNLYEIRNLHPPRAFINSTDEPVSLRRLQLR